MDTDINHECELAISETDVTYTELKAMAFNAIRTSFALPDDQQKVFQELVADFIQFEESHRALGVPARATSER